MYASLGVMSLTDKVGLLFKTYITGIHLYYTQNSNYISSKLISHSQVTINVDLSNACCSLNQVICTTNTVTQNMLYHKPSIYTRRRLSSKTR